MRNRDGNFLGELIEVINQKQPRDKQLSNMNPSDFRDAFTTNVFDSSGGDVRWTMRMLGHKNPATTGDYCDNNLLNDESHLALPIVQHRSLA